MHNSGNIDHGGGFFTLYAHLKTITAGIDGRRVTRGQVIGTVDSTGYSCGPHLHFGLQKGDPKKRGRESISVPIQRLFAREIPLVAEKFFKGREFKCGDAEVGRAYQAVPLTSYSGEDTSNPTNPNTP